MTEAEFQLLLERHDWFHDWSDSGAVRARGHRAETELRQLAVRHGYVPLWERWWAWREALTRGERDAPKPKLG